MKRFLGFVKKEFIHIFRDRRTMLILFGMPVAQLLLFGYVITNEIKDANIAIYDKSKDAVTQKITQKLLSSGYFRLEENIDSYDQVEKSFQKGKVKMLIVFEQDFAKNLEKIGTANVQILADASDPNTANILTTYTAAIIRDYTNSLNQSLSAPMQIKTEIQMQYNPELKGVYMFIPGIIAMLLILISALMTSISITREKELGTMEVLLVSPLKPIQIIIGKVIPYMLFAFIDVIIILLIAVTVFHVDIQGNIALLLGECLLYIFLSLSLGILISSITSSQQIAMMASMLALMLPTILLSGFIFPIENMPLPLQWLCQILPPKWFITILKSIMLKGNGILYIWKETLILVSMTVLFIGISVKKFKIRLE
jgi:ABC-2 type transport system permease protein